MECTFQNFATALMMFGALLLIIEVDGLSYHGREQRTLSALINMTGAIETPTGRQLPTDGSSNNSRTGITGECGVTVGCSTLPSGCSFSSADCGFFEWAYDSTTNKFNMTISGGSGSDSYVGVAFGLVPDMANADLYYCTGAKLQSAYISTQTTPTDGRNTDAGLENIVASATNGVARCSFTRPASVTKSGTNFDLTARSHYILMAHGAIQSGAIRYHGPNDRSLSSSPVDLTSFQGAGAAGINVLIKAHGSLMVVAWLLLSNFGVAVARHFKPLFPDVQPGGIKLWFHLHRFCMVTVLLATAIAFIIIFVEAQGFSSQVQAHAIIGIFVMALALTNPIMALMRPHPNTSNRPIFNWMHYFVGTSARVLSIANLFLGVLAAGMQNWVPILGGFVGWVVLLEIILEILSFTYGHTVLGSDRSKPPPEASNSDMRMEDPKPPPVEGQSVKTAVLVIYVLGLLGFAIAFFVAISAA